MNWGVLNLCYRGNRYKLKDGILSFNVDSSVPKASAASYEFQARTMDEVDTNIEVLGVIMIQQYNLRKGLVWSSSGTRQSSRQLRNCPRYMKWVRTYH